MFVTPILLLASLCLSIHALHDVEWRNANGIGHLGQNANELEFDQSEKKGQRNDNGFGHSSHRHEHPFVPVEEHRGHGPHPHRHCPPPPFLRRLRGQERAGYFRIVSARNASRKEILARLDQWASSIGIQAEYENYTVEAQKRALHFHDMVVGNLSGKALELFNKLWSIRQDESLTRLAACRQIVAVVKTVGKRRQQLLRRLVPIPPPLIWGPPPRGCLPPRPPRSSSSSGSAEDQDIGPMPKIEAHEADVSESVNEPMPKEQRVLPPLPSHALFILDANSDESAEINERIRQGAFHKQMSAPLLKRKADEPEKRILARESDDSKSESREEEYPAVGHRGHDTPIHPSVQRNGGKVRHGGRNNRESSSSSSESAEYRRQNRRQLAEKSTHQHQKKRGKHGKESSSSSGSEEKSQARKWQKGNGFDGRQREMPMHRPDSPLVHIVPLPFAEKSPLAKNSVQHQWQQKGLPWHDMKSSSSSEGPSSSEEAHLNGAPMHVPQMGKAAVQHPSVGGGVQSLPPQQVFDNSAGVPKKGVAPRMFPPTSIGEDEHIRAPEDRIANAEVVNGEPMVPMGSVEMAPKGDGQATEASAHLETEKSAPAVGLEATASKLNVSDLAEQLLRQVPWPVGYLRAKDGGEVVPQNSGMAKNGQKAADPVAVEAENEEPPQEEDF